MPLTQKLELRQGQTLQITPQLVQAIKLLQMPHHDLAAFIEAELESNPLLKQAESDDSVPDEPAEPGEPAGAVAVEEWFFSERQPSAGDFEQAFDAPLDNVFPDDAGRDHGEQRADLPFGITAGPLGSGNDDLPETAQVLPHTISLREHLARQLDIATDDPVQRLIGSYLIDAIDGNGYLTATLAEIAERLGVAEAIVEETLAIVHGFEPTGIGARSLKECLGLQLRERNRLDPAMARFLDHLDLVARRDFASLKRLCGVDGEDIAEMLAEIRRLDPKPGSAFDSEPVELLVPDVLVRANGDGGWHIELNPETLPRVLINQSYRATLAGNGGAHDFLAECLARANWLTRSLEQRARTILKVATEIVRHQEEFFSRGAAALKPLTLRQVADAIGMHESTVSRVAAHKAFGTTRGIFEMKYFFPAAITREDGSEAQASESVRQRIKQLIDQEDPDDVLSDDALVQRLKDENIIIARRTAAKYRESLKIPSSVERRRLKKNMA